MKEKHPVQEILKEINSISKLNQSDFKRRYLMAKIIFLNYN
jgi:hypothetical protein